LVFKPEAIIKRLKELDTVSEELSKYRGIALQELKASLSKRWIIERGLIAGANLIFDIADHILTSMFHIYPDTYEDSLKFLYEKGIMSGSLYEKVKGLGGFRNILVHEYLGIDIEEEYRNFQKAVEIFREFSREILLSDIMNKGKQ